MALIYTEGYGLRLLRKCADQHRRAEICNDGDKLRDNNSAPKPEARALAGTGILARAEVLPDKGGERDGKACDGQKGKALDF